jgi:hypothetical protein
MIPTKIEEILTAQRSADGSQVQNLALFVPVTRIDETERIVEGVAFANEVVEGEGGLRLSRASMQNATPDYLRWGAVREMHQPSAVGRALSVEWTESGAAILRVKVVDDQAWSKVRQGVYQGFSVGVMPRMIRGGTVEQCTWIETSLVDRPKDPDAVFLAFRAEGLSPLEAVITETVKAANPESDWIARLEAELKELKAERDEARKQLAAQVPPVRYPVALTRGSGDQNPLHKELKDLTTPDPSLTFEQQLARLDRIAQIKRDLSI